MKKWLETKMRDETYWYCEVDGRTAFYGDDKDTVIALLPKDREGFIKFQDYYLKQSIWINEDKIHKIEPVGNMKLIRLTNGEGFVVL